MDLIRVRSFLASGSVIICTDPYLDLDPDPDLSLPYHNKYVKP